MHLGSFGPQSQFWLGLRWRGTLSEVPHVFSFLPKIGLWGPKLLQLQNLGGGFVVFFLGGQNRNFVKVRGRKLLLSQKNIEDLFLQYDLIQSLTKKFKLISDIFTRQTNSLITWYNDLTLAQGLICPLYERRVLITYFLTHS